MTDIGRWQPLSEGRGATLTVAGAYTAAAQLGYLTVWTDRRVTAAVSAPRPAPGWPRIVPDRTAEDRVYWGPGIVDLASGRLRTLPGLAAGPDGTAFPAPADPRRYDHTAGALPAADAAAARYLPACYAWSPDGAAVVVTESRVGPPAAHTARAVLRGNTGQLLATLWKAPTSRRGPPGRAAGSPSSGPTTPLSSSATADRSPYSMV